MPAGVLLFEERQALAEPDGAFAICWGLLIRRGRRWLRPNRRTIVYWYIPNRIESSVRPLVGSSEHFLRVFHYESAISLWRLCAVLNVLTRS